MEFLTALFLLFVFGAIFGAKKGKRRSRRKTSNRQSSPTKRPTPAAPTSKPKSNPRPASIKKSPPSETERRLLEAVKSGELLTVAYDGGTQPGATRQIHPLKMFHNKVRAYCYSSNAEKDFFISKIKVQPAGTAVSYEDLAADGALDSVETFKAKYLPLFQARGWTIDHANESVKLFDHFKNKKPRKTPALTLAYEPTYTEIDWLSEDEGTITHQRQKPWYVSTRDSSSQFSNLQRALAKFIMLERELSPFRE